MKLPIRLPCSFSPLPNVPLPTYFWTHTAKSKSYSRILFIEMNVLNSDFVSQNTLSFRRWAHRLAPMLQSCRHLHRCCFQPHSPSTLTTFAIAYAVLVAWGQRALGRVISSEAQFLAESHTCSKWRAGTVF